jgi:dihydrofolate reductase
MVKLIALTDSEWGISRNGEIPWRFPEDSRFFREKTLNTVTVMGRKTFLSIPDRPLKNRINCVVSRTLEPTSGVRIFASPADVTVEYDDFWVIGGARLFSYFLESDLADYALITRVHEKHNADRFINPLHPEKFSSKIIFQSEKYSIIEYLRPGRNYPQTTLPVVPRLT